MSVTLESGPRGEHIPAGQEQKDLIRNAGTQEGIVNFTGAFIGGRMTAFLPLDLKNAGNYRPLARSNPGVREFDGKDFWAFTVQSQTDAANIRQVQIAASILKAPPLIRFEGRNNVPVPQVERGLKFAVGPKAALTYGWDERSEALEFSSGIIYFQTENGRKNGYTAVMVLNSKGGVVNILSPENYISGTVSDLQAYNMLWYQAEDLLGITRLELTRERIDPLKTFEAIINQDLAPRKTKWGAKVVVPQVVFK